MKQDKQSIEFEMNRDHGFIIDYCKIIRTKVPLALKVFLLVVSIPVGYFIIEVENFKLEAFLIIVLTLMFITIFLLDPLRVFSAAWTNAYPREKTVYIQVSDNVITHKTQWHPGAPEEFKFSINEVQDIYRAKDYIVFWVKKNALIVPNKLFNNRELEDIKKQIDTHPNVINLKLPPLL